MLEKLVLKGLASDVKRENNQFKLGDNIYIGYNEAFKQIVTNEESFVASEEFKSIFDKFKEFINTFRYRLSNSTIKAFNEILNGKNRGLNHPLDVWLTRPGFDDSSSIFREGENNLTRNTSPSAYSPFSNSSNKSLYLNFQDLNVFKLENKNIILTFNEVLNSNTINFDITEDLDCIRVKISFRKNSIY